MLNPTAFGLAMGYIYAAWMALVAWGSALLGVRNGLTSMYARFFPGFRPTFLGGLIGALYGLVTGFAFGWGIAALYNRIQAKEAVHEVTPGAPYAGR